MELPLGVPALVPPLAPPATLRSVEAPAVVSTAAPIWVSVWLTAVLPEPRITWPASPPESPRVTAPPVVGFRLLLAASVRTPFWTLTAPVLVLEPFMVQLLVMPLPPMVTVPVPVVMAPTLLPAAVPPRIRFWLVAVTEAIATLAVVGLNVTAPVRVVAGRPRL